MIYKVNEIFHSLQGEGFNQGKEVVFIRLAGCNLSCAWCDTEYHTFTEFSTDAIIKHIAQYDCKSVILTGGEPSTHILDPLLNALKKNDYWTAIETNGTLSLDRYNGLIDYIALSPKSRVNQLFADEVRIVNDDVTVEKLLETEQAISADNYYLSPLELNGNMNIRNTMKLLASVNEVSDKKWRMSLQLHKLIGIR